MFGKKKEEPKMIVEHVTCFTCGHLVARNRANRVMYTVYQDYGYGKSHTTERFYCLADDPKCDRIDEHNDFLGRQIFKKYRLVPEHWEEI